MSDLKQRKSAVVEIPGLAYFTFEAEKPAKAAPSPGLTAPALSAPALAALEQMYGYFGG